MTTESVAKGEMLTQRAAWAAHDGWVGQGGCVFQEEPIGLEAEFRAHSDRKQKAPKDWADSYLAAFASAAGLEVITFDRALSVRARGAVLLRNGWREVVPMHLCQSISRAGDDRHSVAG